MSVAGRIWVALAACVLLEGAAQASEPSVAVLLETTAGSPALSREILSVLSGHAARVVDAGETQAARRFLALPSPIDEAAATKLQNELGVGRLIVVTERRTSGERFAWMVRVLAPGHETRRFASGASTERDRAVAQLVRLAFEGSTPPPGDPAGAHSGSAIVPAPGSLAAESPAESPASSSPPSPGAAGRTDLPGTGGSRGRGAATSRRVVLEAGATFSVFTGTSKYESDGQEDLRANLVDIGISPMIGLFTRTHVEILGSVSYRSSFEAATGTDRSSYNLWSVGGGVAFLPPIGDHLRVGPQFMGYLIGSQRSYPIQELGALRFGAIGNRGNAGVVAKIPLGSSAVLTVDAHYFREVLNLSVHADHASNQFNGNSRMSGVEVLLGLSYWRLGD